MIFKEKYSSYYTLLVDKLPQLLSEILSNMCIAIVCEPGCEVISFVINLIFLIKPFFLQAESQKKKLNILRTKGAFKME